MGDAARQTFLLLLFSFGFLVLFVSRPPNRPPISAAGRQRRAPPIKGAEGGTKRDGDGYGDGYGDGDGTVAKGDGRRVHVCISE